MLNGMKILVAAGVASLVPVVAQADAAPEWLLRKYGLGSRPVRRVAAPVAMPRQRYVPASRHLVWRAPAAAPTYRRSAAYGHAHMYGPMRMASQTFEHQAPMPAPGDEDSDGLRRTSQHVYEGGLASPAPVYAGYAYAPSVRVVPTYVVRTYLAPMAQPVAYATYPLPTTSAVIYNRPDVSDGGGWPAQAGYAYFANGAYAGGSYPASYYPNGGWAGVGSHCGCY